MNKWRVEGKRFVVDASEIDFNGVESVELPDGSVVAGSDFVAYYELPNIEEISEWRYRGGDTFFVVLNQ